MSDVTFTSWGSADSIGPSCHVFKFGSLSCGVDFGAGVRTADPEPALRGAPDVLILTHGHRDHVGMVPRAMARWPKMKVWATFETLQLARCVWEDELVVARKEGHPLPFTDEDIETTTRRIKRIIADQPLALDDEVTVTPFLAGHILGAVGLVFQYRGEHYVITGDIKLDSHGFIGGARVPRYMETRVLVRESTYVGQYMDQTRDSNIQCLVCRTAAVLERGGRVLIPTLTIDRMQEVFDALHQSELDREWPLWVVGGVRPTEIYLDYAPGANTLRQVCRFENRQHQDDVRKSGEPVIVLAGSGMLAPSSPSYGWAVDILEEPASAILMVNWQDPAMPGGIILNGSPDEMLELPTGTFRRRCHVERFDLSSHAKEDEMAAIEDLLNPAKIIHVHGDGDRIDAFISARSSDGPRRLKAQVGVTIPL